MGHCSTLKICKMKSKFTLFRLFLTLLIAMACSAQVALAQLYSSGNNTIAGNKVGIGISTPNTTLFVRPPTYNPYLPEGSRGSIGISPLHVEYYHNPVIPGMLLPPPEYKTAFFIKWDGKVGIGTASPQQKFHLLGNGLVSDNFYVGNRLGIGTSSPQNPLHVKGGAIQIETDYGKTHIGALNANWSHFNTTLPKFYFNKPIYINGGVSSYYGLPLVLQTGGTSQMHIKTNGQVKIGNTAIASGTHADYKLSVDGKIVSKKVVVTLSNWADEVFDEKYQLRPLAEVEKYINTKKHLPEIPTEQEVITEGVDVGEMNRLLLKKVEELTLYILQLEERIKKIESKGGAK